MTSAEAFASGKGANDENFPVASRLIHPRYRPAILAFYRFVRAADDIADHPNLAPVKKLALLDQLERALTHDGDDPAALALRQEINNRGLEFRQALDILIAFRQDVTKLRYETWDELINYCRYSAATVGRFVLDVHGEDRATWPASDALCAALQVINHVQDCADDRRILDRCYLPLVDFSREQTTPDALLEPRASKALRRVIAGVVQQTVPLLDQARPLAGQIRNRRLCLEVAVIQSLAEQLLHQLARRDPLCERVHLGRVSRVFTGLRGLARGLVARPVCARPTT